MKYLILLFFFLGSIVSGYSQYSNVEDVDRLKTLKAKDTLTIKVSSGGCYLVDYIRILVVDKDTNFQLFYVRDFLDDLERHNKMLMPVEELEGWIKYAVKNNMINHRSTTLSKAEYYEFIDKLAEWVQNLKGCSSEGAGDHSIFTMDSEDIKLSYNYPCLIAMDYLYDSLP